MASDPMKNRVFRVDDDTWERYGRACADKGISRSDDLRMYVRQAVAQYEREQRRIAREQAESGS